MPRLSRSMKLAPLNQASFLSRLGTYFFGSSGLISSGFYSGAASGLGANGSKEAEGAVLGYWADPVDAAFKKSKEFDAYCGRPNALG